MKYKMLFQLWLDVRPASQSVGQHQTIIIGRTSRVSRGTNTTHRSKVGPMLGQRRRRCANIGPTLNLCVVFAGEALTLGFRKQNNVNIE